ncbi:unnamed protein product, partial [Heterosigma akashiwo]
MRRISLPLMVLESACMGTTTKWPSESKERLYFLHLLSKAQGIGPDGYIVDFGDLKKVSRELCKELNERILIPINSNVIDFTDQQRKTQQQLELECQDGAFFSFPKADCALLPIVHSTVEEIGVFLWVKVLERLGLEFLHDRNATHMAVTVEEAPSQSATFRRRVPASAEELAGVLPGAMAAVAA